MSETSSGDSDEESRSGKIELRKLAWENVYLKLFYSFYSSFRHSSSYFDHTLEEDSIRLPTRSSDIEGAHMVVWRSPDPIPPFFMTSLLGRKRVWGISAMFCPALTWTLLRNDPLVVYTIIQRYPVLYKGETSSLLITSNNKIQNSQIRVTTY